MTRLLRIFCAVAIPLFLLGHASSGWSETATAPQANRMTDDVQKDLDNALSKNSQLEQIIRFLNQNLADAQSPIRKRFDEAKLTHDIRTMRQIEDVYNWQIAASNVALWLVVVIVMAGVIFSGFQLWHAARMGQPQAESQLEISAKNFRLTSSVVGVVVLGLSFFFFFLFVKEIYSVRPPTLATAAQSK